MLAGRALVMCLALLSSSAACRDEALQPTCRSAAAAGDHVRAATLCADAFDRGGDTEAGALAAAAHGELGQTEPLLAIARRLPPAAGTGRTWRAVGKALQDAKDTAGAKEAYRRALERDLATRDDRGAAQDCNELALILWRASEFLTALDYARRSYAHAGAAGDLEGRIKASSTLAAIFIDVGHLRAAYSVLHAGARLIPPEQVERRARFRVNEGIVLTNAGRPALALAVLEESLRLYPPDTRVSSRRLLHLNLATAHTLLGNLAEAEHHMAEARRYASLPLDPTFHFRDARILRLRGRLAEAEQAARLGLASSPAPNRERLLYLELGEALEAKGDAAAAEAAYERSFTILEQLRRSLGVSDIKEALTSQRRDAYEAIFRLRARRGAGLAALAMAERVKARTFLDARIGGELGADLGAPDALTDIEQVSGEASATLSSMLPALDVTPAVEPPAVEVILDKLGPRHALSYFVAGEELWLIAVATGSVRLRLVAPLMKDVDRLVASLTTAPDDAAAAGELGALLLPAELLPAPGTRLSLVTDKSLSRVSFAALRVRGRSLMEDYTIAYAPSLAALALATWEAPPALDAPVVLADPWGDLEGAASEAQSIAVELGVVPRLGGEVTIAGLRSSSAASLLHLATHTGVGATGPWMALADGVVDAASVLRWRLRPRVVVLASCASAARRGGELWGSTAAAFLAAGSDVVIATLSSVPDEAARDLIVRFYAEGGERDPAGALARAQRRLLAEGRPPSEWAPFVALGQVEPLEGGGPSTRPSARLYP